MPAGEFCHPSPPPMPRGSVEEEEWLWGQIKTELCLDAEAEPALASYLYSTILSHSSLERSLSFHLGNKLCSPHFSMTSSSISSLPTPPSSPPPSPTSVPPASVTPPVFPSPTAFSITRDSSLARLTEGLISYGLNLERVVAGETAVIGNNVSILHHVTFGGTGHSCGDRHPKIRDGVLIGTGATILGNVIIGEGAKIGAGSVVLIDVPPRTTAVGNPARLLGGKEQPTKHDEIPGESMDHTSFMSEWSDNII
ncbi:serine O-acetyltransferase [Salvia divinorum]|uniref:serine O-acetyltransferase n=1 Tax=Salvia divinorum TaxID=28513 RepID=A0ABD1FHT6_SALDI